LKNLKYYFAAIIAFSVWGSFSLVLKPLHAYASLDILFYRVFSCALIMTVFSLLFKRQKIKENLSLFKSLRKRDKRQMIGLNTASSLFLTVNWFSFIYVMNHVSVRATSVAYLVCPILTTLLAFSLLHEKLSRIQWLSVGLSCAGCLLLSYSNIMDMFFSAIVGLSYACYLVNQTKNIGFDKFLVLNFHILLSALVLLLFYPAFSGSIPSDLKFYVYVEIIAVGYTILPLLLNLYALTRISSSTVGMLLNINPIIAFVLAGLVYHEPLGTLQIFAYGLIFLAVLVFNMNQVFSSVTADI
jgi:chloramphenicol-sensitive protein RarD